MLPLPNLMERRIPHGRSVAATARAVALSRATRVFVALSIGFGGVPGAGASTPGDSQVVALLGPSHQASFKFHFADLLGGKTGGQPTLPEIRGLRGLRLLCVYGTGETDSACRDLPPDLASVAAMPGGHHFGGAYREVARRILHVAQAN